MSFYSELALNANTMASDRTGLALSHPGKTLHGFFIAQTDEVSTTLTSTMEIWAKDPGGTYIPVVQQADLDDNTWISSINADFQKYVNLGDVNTTSTNSVGDGVHLPYSDNWRIVVRPTNGTADDAMLVVAFLSEGRG